MPVIFRKSIEAGGVYTVTKNRGCTGESTPTTNGQTCDIGSFDYLRDNMTSLASPSELIFHPSPDLTLVYVTLDDGE